MEGGGEWWWNFLEGFPLMFKYIICTESKLSSEELRCMQDIISTMIHYVPENLIQAYKSGLFTCSELFPLCGF
jgi:hypothetical protein